MYYKTDEFNIDWVRDFNYGSSLKELYNQVNQKYSTLSTKELIWIIFV